MDFSGGSPSKGQQEGNCTNRKGNLSVARHCPTQRVSVCTHHVPTSCHIYMNNEKRKRPFFSSYIKLHSIFQLFKTAQRHLCFLTWMCRPSAVPRYATARPWTGTTLIEVTKVLVSSLCQYSNLWTNWVTCRRYLPSLPSWIPSCGSQSLEELWKNETKGTNKTESLRQLPRIKAQS